MHHGASRRPPSPTSTPTPPHNPPSIHCSQVKAASARLLHGLSPPQKVGWPPKQRASAVPFSTLLRPATVNLLLLPSHPVPSKSPHHDTIPITEALSTPPRPVIALSTKSLVCFSPVRYQIRLCRRRNRLGVRSFALLSPSQTIEPNPNVVDHPGDAYAFTCLHVALLRLLPTVQQPRSSSARLELDLAPSADRVAAFKRSDADGSVPLIHPRPYTQHAVNDGGRFAS